MLNTTLTVRQGEPNSHAKRGWCFVSSATSFLFNALFFRWETFTDAIIRKVGQQEGIVFLLWGKPAHAKYDAGLCVSRAITLTMVMLL